MPREEPADADLDAIGDAVLDGADAPASDTRSDALTDGPDAHVDAAPECDQPVEERWCLDDGTAAFCDDGLIVAQPCSVGWTCCAGICVDTDVSNDHCGHCDVPCEGGEGVACSFGECELECADGLVDFDRDEETGCECSLYDPAGNCPACEEGTTACVGAEDLVYVRLVDGPPEGDGTLSDPFTDIQAALDTIGPGDRVVVVMAGDPALSTALRFPAAAEVWLLGGYDIDFERNGGARSTINGAPLAVDVPANAVAHVSYLDVQAAQGQNARNDGQSGQSSIAVRVVDADLFLFEVGLEARDGGNGDAGRIGRSGDELGTPAMGADGLPQVPDCVAGQLPPGCAEDRLAGGAGAPETECEGVANGGRGGSGGAGAWATGFNLVGNGEAGAGQRPGVGGTTLFGMLDGQDGRISGFDAAFTIDGIGGGPFGYVRDQMWHASPGTPGFSGYAGSGGGGGAGLYRPEAGTWGASGAGGGGGGCPGEGGLGGGGGGGSFGLLLLDSQVWAAETVITTSTGGDGAVGGPGGSGGSGAEGGEGGPGTSDGGEARVAGNGGAGSAGTPGGAGGGGAAGPSIAILAISSSVEDVSDSLTLAPGQPGEPGQRFNEDGVELSDGFTGYAAPMLSWIIPDSGDDCPRGMVSHYLDAATNGVNRVCIDATEATRPFATETEAINVTDGFEGAQSLVQLGVRPWNDVTPIDALVACMRASKFACYSEFLEDTCSGGGARMYPYGIDHQSGRCNDASADIEHPIAAGSLASCRPPTRPIYDLTGNLAEYSYPDPTRTQVDLSNVIQVAGGSFLSDDSEAQCTSTEDVSVNITATEIEWGFRCCITTEILAPQEWPAP